MTEIRKLNEQTWIFDEGGVYFYLLCGDETALLLDSGMHTENIRGLAASLTDLPLVLMNTHADRDHIGGNHEFEWFYMDPAEASNFYNTQKSSGQIQPVYHFGKSTTPDRPDQTWVNCLNLFVAGYTV